MLPFKYIYQCAYKYCLDNGYKSTSSEYFATTSSDRDKAKIEYWRAPGVSEPTVEFLLSYCTLEEADIYGKLMASEYTYMSQEKQGFMNLIRSILVDLNYSDPDQWIKEHI